jgi:hypothetical protein
MVSHVNRKDHSRSWSHAEQSNQVLYGTTQVEGRGYIGSNQRQVGAAGISGRPEGFRRSRITARRGRYEA